MTHTLPTEPLIINDRMFCSCHQCKPICLVVIVFSLQAIPLACSQGPSKCLCQHLLPGALQIKRTSRHPNSLALCSMHTHGPSLSSVPSVCSHGPAPVCLSSCSLSLCLYPFPRSSLLSLLPVNSLYTRSVAWHHFSGGWGILLACAHQRYPPCHILFHNRFISTH